VLATPNVCPSGNCVSIAAEMISECQGPDCRRLAVETRRECPTNCRATYERLTSAASDPCVGQNCYAQVPTAEDCTSGSNCVMPRPAQEECPSGANCVIS
jgi:hypothetical protein